jgi:hypothetical protein
MIADPRSDTRSKSMNRITVAASFLMALMFATNAVADSFCTGCGCEGGPGYRGPNGKCVSWMSIGKVCGSPPSQRCTAEIVNVGANAAADYGVNALESKRPAVPTKP